MGNFLFIYMAGIGCDDFAGKKITERRICTLGDFFGNIWAFVRRIFCSRLKSRKYGICPYLLDPRTSMGCMACSGEFCVDAHSWKTALQSALLLEEIRLFAVSKL